MYRKYESKSDNCLTPLPCDLMQISVSSDEVKFDAAPLHPLRHRNAWKLTAKRWHVVRQVSQLNLDVRKYADPNAFKDEVRSWVHSFQKLMRSDLGRQIFTKFLESEFSDENMLFWNACEDYKRETKNVKRHMIGKSIYDTFLKPLAPLEINIDDNLRQEVLRNMEIAPNRESFNKAQQHIYHLLERDSFPRFLRSEAYTTFAACIENGTTANDANFDSH